MTTERAMRLAEQWANGLVCSVRDGEAAEYHKMFLDMLRTKQEAEKSCERCRMSKWISVKDRLPPNYISVLCYIPSLASSMRQTVHECHIGADGEWSSATAPAYRENVTHWMPLPEPSKEDSI